MPAPEGNARSSSCMFLGRALVSYLNVTGQYHFNLQVDFSRFRLVHSITETRRSAPRWPAPADVHLGLRDCRRLMREYANVDPFRIANQPIQRRSAQPVAPAATKVVADENLRDSVCACVIEDRLDRI